MRLTRQGVRDLGNTFQGLRHVYTCPPHVPSVVFTSEGREERCARCGEWLSNGTLGMSVAIRAARVMEREWRAARKATQRALARAGRGG